MRIITQAVCIITIFLTLSVFSQERVRSLRPKYFSAMTVAGYVGGETLTNFPVAVRISKDAIAGFDYEQCRGQDDISFSDANGMSLPCEIECWNTNGESIAWVSLPSVSTNSPTTFTMNWKHSILPDDSNSTSIWTNAKYLGAWHFNSPYNPVATNYQANSAGNFDLALYNNASISRVDNGVVGNAFLASLSSSGAIDLFTTPHLVNNGLVNTGFVLSGWSYWRGNTANNARQVFIINPTGSASYKWQLYIKSKKLYSRFGAGGEMQLGTNYVHTAWFHWSVRVSNKEKWDYFINGKWQQTRTTSQLKYINYMISMTYSIGGSQGYTDEIRIHNVAASDDWIKAEYDSMANKNFITAAPAVRRPDPLRLIIR